MIFIPVIIVIIFAIVFMPTSRGRGRRRKGFFETLLKEQKKTEHRNRPHAPMNDPGGSKRK